MEFSKYFAVIVMIAMLLCVSNLEGKPAIKDGSQNPVVTCKLPAMKGHCRAILKRWRYNPATAKCEEFYWGGCDGNGNNFASYKSCMAVCEGI